MNGEGGGARRRGESETSRRRRGDGADERRGGGAEVLPDCAVRSEVAAAALRNARRRGRPGRAAGSGTSGARRGPRNVRGAPRAAKRPGRAAGPLTSRRVTSGVAPRDLWRRAAGPLAPRRAGASSCAAERRGSTRSRPSSCTPSGIRRTEGVAATASATSIATASALATIITSPGSCTRPPRCRSARCRRPRPPCTTSSRAARTLRIIAETGTVAAAGRSDARASRRVGRCRLVAAVSRASPKRGGGSRRRRWGDARIFRGWVAATPLGRRADIPRMGRGDAAGATRGYSEDGAAAPWGKTRRGVAATRRRWTRHGRGSRRCPWSRRRGGPRSPRSSSRDRACPRIRLSAT